jgi:hypothetical protein
MIVLSQLALKTHTNLGCAASFVTLDKLVDKFTLPPVALPIPIGDASLSHVIKLVAHSTTSPTPTAMRQSFIMIPYTGCPKNSVLTVRYGVEEITVNVRNMLKKCYWTYLLIWRSLKVALNTSIILKYVFV